MSLKYLQKSVYEEGDIILFMQGEYSHLRAVGVYRVLKTLDLKEVATAIRAAKAIGERFDEVAGLLHHGYVEEVEYEEINLDYDLAI